MAIDYRFMIQNSPFDAPAGTVRRVGEPFAAEALAILREVTAWAIGRGIEVWKAVELREQDFIIAAESNELVMGFSGDRSAATMRIQTSDLVYWPEVAPNTSLFLHKIAVRREFAGRDWLRRLIEFAVADAKDSAIGWIRLDTLHSSRLQGLYEKQGFAVVEEAPFVVHGQLMIRMQRAL
jgi:ribosomal protein S18 acetylase RimI-like enzyme